MAVQTTYGVYHNAKYAGAVNSVNPYATVSKLNTSGENIPYGLFVAGDGDNGFTALTDASTATDVIGVTMRELNRAYADDETFGAVAGRDAAIVNLGHVAVTTAAAVAITDTVYVGVGSDVAGMVTNAAGSGTTLAVELPGAKFAESVDAGEPVFVNLISVGA
jgi:hypothetical protein